MKYLCLVYVEEKLLHAMPQNERIASKFPAAQFGSIEVRPLKEHGCA